MYGAKAIGYSHNEVPSKVQAAMQFIHFCEEVRRGPCGPIMTAGDSPSGGGRELSKAEADVYDSALTTLLEFFNEPGFGGESAGPEPSGDDPKNPEPVNA